MSFVAINVLEVPAQMRETLEQRFAARAGEVDGCRGSQAAGAPRSPPSYPDPQSTPPAAGAGTADRIHALLAGLRADTCDVA